MNLSKGYAVILTLAIVVLGVYTFTRPTANTVTYTDPETGETTVGAVSTLNSPIEVNGTATYYYGEAFKLATSTVVNFKSPPATTTMAYFNSQTYTGTTTSSIYTLATSTIQNATTSALATYNVEAGARPTNLYIGVATTVVTNAIIPPNTWISLGVSGGQGYNTGVTGHWSASLRGI